MDYHPFGLAIAGRAYNKSNYRFGFNGMEKSDDLTTGGYTSTYRQYNPSIGRWMSIDPEWAIQPAISTYVGFNNNPILYKDTKGDFVIVGTLVIGGATLVYWGVVAALTGVAAWEVKKLSDKGVIRLPFVKKPSSGVDDLLTAETEAPSPSGSDADQPKPDGGPSLPVPLAPENRTHTHEEFLRGWIAELEDKEASGKISIEDQRLLDQLRDDYAKGRTSFGEDTKPYANHRPSYGKDQVDKVWENAPRDKDGNVRDPNTNEIIKWDRSKPREGQWDMGHIFGEKYEYIHQQYMEGIITRQEFLDWYQNPKNYQPELPKNNRSRKYD